VVVSRSRPPTPPAPQVPDQTPPEGYKVACFVCHDDHMMRQQHLTRAQWDREVTKMSGWGAGVKPEQRDAILDFLASSFKP
jgi:hypothetical protein